MNTSRSRMPVAKKITMATSVDEFVGLGSMKTIAPDAPTSHNSARCKREQRQAPSTAG